jgi:pimeloyl-ACP methyl ester carboxylesterase
MVGIRVGGVPTLVVVAMAAGLTSVAAQTAQTPGGIAGAWQGALDVAGARLTLRIVFTEGAGGFTGTIDIPEQGASGLPLRNVTSTGPAVRFELPAGPALAVFNGRREGDAIEGDFTQGQASGRFRLTRVPGAAAAIAPSPPPPYREEEVTFANGSVTVAGTLTIPPGRGPFPAVVMITGSGAQNRDEELFGFRPFRVLADHLARHGIAALRYDDRGIGGSSGSVADSTTEDFAADALAGLDLLGRRAEIDAARIGLLGHSEGATAAAIAAARSPRVSFVVMMAGTALRGDEVLRGQAADLARAGGATDEAVARILAEHRRVTDAVRAGAPRAELAEAVRALSRAQIAAMPEAQRQAIGDPDKAIERTLDAHLASVQSRWFRYLLDFDPASALARVTCPVLALFGALDLQVPPAANRAAAESALQRAKNRWVTVKVYPDANHLFIGAVSGHPSEYPTLEKRFVPGLLEDVSQWILQGARKAPHDEASGVFGRPQRGRR